jgi:8-oxo-dGTP diphosphatase
MSSGDQTSWIETRALIEREDGHYLILRPSNPGIDARWDFPGARLRIHEDPTDAIRRICRDRLRVVVKVRATQPPMRFNFGTHAIDFLYFLCRIEAGEPQPGGQIECRWVLPAQMREYYFEPGIQQVVDRIIPGE